MGDISSIDNETVGAASRVVHQGLSDFIGEFMKIEHIRSEVEGQTINVEAGEESFLYNFIGGDDLELPQSGRLIHRGWKVSQMMLQRKLKIAQRQTPWFKEPKSIIRGRAWQIKNT